MQGAGTGADEPVYQAIPVEQAAHAPGADHPPTRAMRWATSLLVLWSSLQVVLPNLLFAVVAGLVVVLLAEAVALYEVGALDPMRFGMSVAFGGALGLLAALTAVVGWFLRRRARRSEGGGSWRDRVLLQLGWLLAAALGLAALGAAGSGAAGGAGSVVAGTILLAAGFYAILWGLPAGTLLVVRSVTWLHRFGRRERFRAGLVIAGSAVLILWNPSLWRVTREAISGAVSEAELQAALDRLEDERSLEAWRAFLSRDARRLASPVARRPTVSDRAAQELALALATLAQAEETGGGGRADHGAVPRGGRDGAIGAGGPADHAAVLEAVAPTARVADGSVDAVAALGSTGAGGGVGGGSSDQVGALGALTQGTYRLPPENRDPVAACLDELTAQTGDAPSPAQRAVAQVCRGRQPCDAEDIVHEKLIDICLRHADTPYDNLIGAFRRAVRNARIDRLRSPFVFCTIEEAPAACFVRHPEQDDGIRLPGERALLRRLWCGLDGVTQKIVTLRVMEGYSFREIGRQVGLTEAKAKNTHHNALKKLRREYEKHLCARPASPLADY